MFKKLFIFVAACALLLAAASIADAMVVEEPADIACVNYAENGAYVGDQVPGPLACQWLYQYGWHCDGTAVVTWSLYNPNEFDVQVRTAGNTFNMTPGEALNFTTVENAYVKKVLTADTYAWKIIEEPVVETPVEEPVADEPVVMALVEDPTATPTPDEEPTATPVPDEEPTATPTPDEEPTATPEPTVTPTPTPIPEPVYGWVLIGTTTATFSPANITALPVPADTTAHTFALGTSSEMSYIFENGKPVQQISGKNPASAFAVPTWATGFIYN